jgi:hypothetical protein
MGRVSAQNHVVHKRKTLLDFEIFSDLNPKKSAFSPLCRLYSSVSCFLIYGCQASYYLVKSLARYLPSAEILDYAATKAAIVGFTKGQLS